MDTERLREHMRPFIDLIKESGSEYFWIASGAIRDYFTTGGVTPKDIDIFFPDKDERDKAHNFLIDKKFKILKILPRRQGIKFDLEPGTVPEEYSHLSRGSKYSYFSMDVGCWDGKDNVRGRYASTPQECVSWFDFTIEMAALDSKNEFSCHPDFEYHIKNKILVRNSIQDAFPRGNNRRLLKYIKLGFTIDQSNLQIWLQDQEATFEYRRQKNKKTHK